jgi:GNAT superfamily N-acetyltransferase
MRTEVESETYDIYSIDLENLPVVHRFSHEISVAQKEQTHEIEQFMVSTHPRINRKWVKVALKNGDGCLIVRLNNEIAGLGWLSMVNGVGRLHSLYVKPQFRRIGIGEDILYARLLWLKLNHARSAFSEISRYNLSSSRIAMKGQMRVSGQVFQYFKRDLDRKKELKSQQSI